jgi:hypothetical protein
VHLLAHTSILLERMAMLADTCRKLTLLRMEFLAVVGNMQVELFDKRVSFLQLLVDELCELAKLVTLAAQLLM